jgi:hypothetical protein
MLIDDLIADGAPGSGSDISCLMPQLRKAQKFVLAPEFAAVADVLASDYTGLVKAFEHCRLPYIHTWIEVAQADRPMFCTAQMQAPRFQVPPKRVGFLLSATREDLSAWRTHIFWSTDNGCSCPMLAMDFDMLSEIDTCSTLPTDEETRKHFDNSLVLEPGATDSHPGWSLATETVRLSMINHVKPVLPDYNVPLPIGVPRHHIREFYEALGDLSRADWAGEPAFLLAVIGLLNARNAIETETVSHPKLNRARIKRGKLPLFEHRILKIAHRQHKRVYGEAGSRGDYAPMRGHFVRGHFKTRRTGIFFWHPHARGSFERGSIVKDYEVMR